MKLYLDAGHGGNDPGAVGNGLQEKEVVLDLANRIHRMMRTYPNAQVKQSRSKDETKSLAARTDEANAWGADIFLSLHCNAFNGKAQGYEDFIYNQLPANSVTPTYQNILHQQVAKVIGMPNRGRKKANFHVLRESNMPAILTENGFIDNPKDSLLMKQAAWRERVAAAHVAGLAEIFKLKIGKVGIKTYSIISGSFQQRANAEARKAELRTQNIPAHITQVKVNQRNMYRVQAGTFTNRKDAEAERRRLARIGVETFIV